MKNENWGFCQNSYGCIFNHFVSLFPCFKLLSEGLLISAIKSQNCQWNQQCLEFVPNLYCSLTIKGTKLVKELTPAHKLNKQIGLHIWASILQAVQACFKYAMVWTITCGKHEEYHFTCIGYDRVLCIINHAGLLSSEMIITPQNSSRLQTIL